MRQSPPSLPLYRSRHGWLLGVCQGLADWRNMPVTWVRLAMIIAIALTGFWLGIAVYVILGLIMKPAPMAPIESDEELEFYSTISSSRQQALRRLQRTFEELDRRTRRLEHSVTSSEFEWEQRLNSGK
ncbi:envelope stress response membrane protein PspC [Cerasicoccus fimbriatus]|uniref:envelope stress response membrane protein PspC n=1 Tax=Cerasicoccus fimbriatus TaxID=3014554 RepID=UPI0022B3C4F2|nr:envelope stress response membrane protein PspC [Cerasicoccus sp. TK19100]